MQDLCGQGLLLSWSDRAQKPQRLRRPPTLLVVQMGEQGVPGRAGMQLRLLQQHAHLLTTKMRAMLAQKLLVLPGHVRAPPLLPLQLIRVNAPLPERLPAQHCLLLCQLPSLAVQQTMT